MNCFSLRLSNVLFFVPIAPQNRASFRKTPAARGDLNHRKVRAAPLGPLRYLLTVLRDFAIFHTVSSQSLVKQHLSFRASRIYADNESVLLASRRLFSDAMARGNKNTCQAEVPRLLQLRCARQALLERAMVQNRERRTARNAGNGVRRKRFRCGGSSPRPSSIWAAELTCGGSWDTPCAMRASTGIDRPLMGFHMHSGSGPGRGHRSRQLTWSSSCRACAPDPEYRTAARRRHRRA
jgi:hypothetical protein